MTVGGTQMPPRVSTGDRPGCSAPTDTAVRGRSDTGELALRQERGKLTTRERCTVCGRLRVAGKRTTACDRTPTGRIHLSRALRRCDDSISRPVQHPSRVSLSRRIPRSRVYQRSGASSQTPPPAPGPSTKYSPGLDTDRSIPRSMGGAATV